jgi:hypothetical protein
MKKESAMKIARVLFVAVLSVMLLTAVSNSQELARLTVNDVGTTLDTPQILMSENAAISPDGKWIAYSGGSMNTALFLKPLNGGAEELLYFYDQFAEQFKDDPVYNDPRLPLYMHGNHIEYITFTPDSKEVTFEVGILDSTKGSTWQFGYDENGHSSGGSTGNPVPYLKSVNIETREVRDITTGINPVWDPTGRYLYLSYWDERFVNDRQYLYYPAILDTQTGELQMLDNKS